MLDLIRIPQALARAALVAAAFPLMFLPAVANANPGAIPVLRSSGGQLGR